MSPLLVLLHKLGFFFFYIGKPGVTETCFKAFASHSQKKLTLGFPVTRLQSCVSIRLLSSQSLVLFCTTVQYQVPKGEDELQDCRQSKKATLVFFLLCFVLVFYYQE